MDLLLKKLHARVFAGTCDGACHPLSTGMVDKKPRRRYSVSLVLTDVIEVSHDWNPEVKVPWLVRFAMGCFQNRSKRKRVAADGRKKWW